MSDKDEKSGDDKLAEIKEADIGTPQDQSSAEKAQAKVISIKTPTEKQKNKLLRDIIKNTPSF